MENTRRPRVRESDESYSKSAIGLFYVIPYTVLAFLFVVCPFALGICLSFFKADLFGARRFVGTDNYFKLLNDELFIKAVRNTICFVSMTVPTLTVISFILAVIATSAGRLSAVFRGVFFSSTLLSVTVVTLAWRLMLNADNGLFNSILIRFDVSPVVFLGTPSTALPAIALVTVWWCIGLPMMLFIAALQQIPQAIYDAAAIDDIGFLHRHLYLTVPLIRRSIISVIFIEAILQFQLFGQSELMTFGGPNGATTSIVLFIHQVGFDRWDIGYAAAASQLLFLIIVVITIISSIIRGLVGWHDELV